MNDLIKKWEGLKLDAYKCEAGVLTIGYGSTHYSDGSPVRRGDRLATKQAAEQLLAWHLENEINRYLDKDFPNLLPNEREALQSLLYNWGYSDFRKSKLFKALKAKDIGEIYKQWDIITAGGKVSRGLIRRRIDELRVFFAVD